MTKIKNDSDFSKFFNKVLNEVDEKQFKIIYEELKEDLNIDNIEKALKYFDITFDENMNISDINDILYKIIALYYIHTDITKEIHNILKMKENNNIIIPSERMDDVNYIIPKKCIEKSFPLGNLNIGKLIACGAFGCVYYSCYLPEFKSAGIFGEPSSEIDYVIKIIVVGETKFDSISNIIHETKITEIAGKNNIGPKLLKYWDCESEIILKRYTKEKKLYKIDRRLFFMLLEKMDISLKMYKEKFPQLFDKYEKQILKMINDKVKKLHSLNIFHKDLHSGNIMLNLKPDNSIKDLKIIDYGMSEIAETKDRIDVLSKREKIESLELF